MAHLKRVSIHPEKFPHSDFYPFNLRVFHLTQALNLETPVTMFVGENGSGKSTLLEAIARASTIHIWRSPDGDRTVRNPYERSFHKYISLEWKNGSVPGSYFSSENFRYFTRAVDEWAVSDPTQLNYFGGKSLVTQSHGQSLMSYFKNRYQIRGLYLLDEPETALSPRSQLELLSLVTRMSAAGHAQFIIATHSPILLAVPGACIYSFDRAPLEPVEYQATEHYRVYKEFMQAPEKYIDNISP